MEEMSIREFARRSHLSAKALRLYDGLGLLSPARVDELSGYRYYESSQLERARLIATVRQIGLPLATVKEMADLHPAEISERVTRSGARPTPSTTFAKSSSPPSSIDSPEGAPSCTKSPPEKCPDAACCA